MDTDSFDAADFLAHLRRGWRLVALACLVAAALAAGVSLLLQKKYTATARILIQPPPSGDPRLAVAVSPIYLESLRTYEHFASSDSLFQRALEKFALRGPGDRRAIESWKQRVLEVGIARNTRILEISATLPEPRKAQAFAEFVARETIALNRNANLAADKALVTSAEAQWTEATNRLARATAAWQRAKEQDPVEALTSEIEAGTDHLADLQRGLESAEMLVTEDREREKTVPAGERAAVATESRLAALRAADLRVRIRAQEREIGRMQQELARRSAREDMLLAERKAAETAWSAAETRLRDVHSAAGNRGEQLEIIDPGIVPERPSSPNLPLNVVAGFLLALVLSLLWLTLRFSAPVRRPAVRAAGRHE